jgi:hypothetical protein
MEIKCAYTKQVNLGDNIVTDIEDSIFGRRTETTIETIIVKTVSTTLQPTTKPLPIITLTKKTFNTIISKYNT